jgi:hypothetical protein
VNAPGAPKLTKAQYAALERVTLRWMDNAPLFASFDDAGILELTAATRRHLLKHGLIEEFDWAAERVRRLGQNGATPPFKYYRPTAAGRALLRSAS